MKQEEVVSGRNVVRAVLSGDVHVIAAGASLLMLLMLVMLVLLNAACSRCSCQQNARKVTNFPAF